MRIIIATNNSHKAKEIAHRCGQNIEILTLKDIGFTREIEETGNTFEENSYLKSKTIKEEMGMDCIADDSGLVVEALGGEPGVFSARYAGVGASDKENTTLLLERMKGMSNRKAKFVTVICLQTGDQHNFFEGELTGSIAESERGSNGFGYDPVFIPEGANRTLAEMSLDEKNAISHRSIAIGKLIQFLKSKPNS